MLSKIKVTFAVLALSLGGAVLAQAPGGAAMGQPPAQQSVRIRGEIVSLKGDTLVVKREGGDPVDIALKPDAKIGALKKISLSKIKAGSYVATTARPGPNGTLVAIELRVFPPALKGAGEGHRPWDLGQDTSMTNANVDAVVKGTHGRELKLSYQGGTQTVTIPKKVTVMMPIPASRADLTKGKKVFINATQGPDGKVVTDRVTVEKHGVVPNM
jgi:hypothetical protein